MTKRTNRVSWGLAVALAVLVVGGIGLLFVQYQNCLPPAERWLTLLPRSEWGFGTTLGMSSRVSGDFFSSNIETTLIWRRRFGFFAVRVN
jgi:hypothetical protein